MNISKIEALSTILCPINKNKEINLKKEKEQKVEKIESSNKNHFDKYS